MSDTTRRTFLGAAGTFLIVRPEQVRGTQANSAVRLGLLGCGGRGTGVAAGFVTNAGARLTALGDLFPDQVERARAQFEKAGQAKIDAGHLYHGPKAYEQLFHSDAIDAVYIATPVWFHPYHFEAAVAAGKHVYVEKPVAVDIPGVERALRAAAKAKGRQSVTVGLQLRHATPYVELVKRIHGGALGEIVCGLVHYYAGPIDRPAWPDATPAERRLRNWIFDRALSGDIIVEQNVHVLDFTNWALNAHPLRVSGTAGRKGRRDTGDCSSHYDLTYSYPNDLHISFASTQFLNGAWDVAMRYFGTKANSEAHYDAPVRITGEGIFRDS
jgi:predicted dehydrogenase